MFLFKLGEAICALSAAYVPHFIAFCGLRFLLAVCCMASYNTAFIVGELFFPNCSSTNISCTSKHLTVTIHEGPTVMAERYKVLPKAFRSLSQIPRFKPKPLHITKLPVTRVGTYSVARGGGGGDDRFYNKCIIMSPGVRRSCFSENNIWQHTITSGLL